MTAANNYISSEHYRQMLVRDGDRRFREWHNKFLEYQQEFINRPRTASSTPSSPSDSEAYRQMLVRDGDRRFQEWHTKFLKSQKDYLNR
jgi:cbb3-type cytochrome oxidase cytochrome c subunit